MAADTDLYVRRRVARRSSSRPARRRAPWIASVAASAVLAAGGAAAVGAMGHHELRGARASNAPRTTPPPQGGVSRLGLLPRVTAPASPDAASPVQASTPTTLLAPASPGVGSGSPGLGGGHPAAGAPTLPLPDLSLPQPAPSPGAGATVAIEGPNGPTPDQTTTPERPPSTPGAPGCGVTDDWDGEGGGDGNQGDFARSTSSDVSWSAPRGEDADSSPRCSPSPVPPDAEGAQLPVITAGTWLR
jgi:hypothetical protein